MHLYVLVFQCPRIILLNMIPHQTSNSYHYLGNIYNVTLSGTQEYLKDTHIHARFTCLA